MHRTALLLTSVLSLVPSAAAQHSSQGDIQLGPWRAWLDSPGGELPFGLEFARDERGGLHATILNDPERIEIPIVQLDGRKIVLRFDDYDSEIRARLSDDDNVLEGQWFKAGRGGQMSEMDFHAEAGTFPRFRARGAAQHASTPLEGRWRAAFESSDEPAVAEFAEAQDDGVTGTFLTPTGDYRYLAGDYGGARLRLSCFDGSHAFLFTAAAIQHGKGEEVAAHESELRGDFWSGASWHETWSAVRDPNAALPDAFAETIASKNAPDLSKLVYTGLDGRRVSLAELRNPDRPMIVELFGSWCPNCADAADDLAALQKEYRKAGLVVVGLAFERTDEFERSAERVRAYAARHGISYPLLIGGVANKESVAAAFPLIDQLRAYPTTVFIDANGRVRAVHTGYSGPATGEEHTKLEAEFRRIVREMLDEVIK